MKARAKGPAHFSLSSAGVMPGIMIVSIISAVGYASNEGRAPLK